MSTSTPAAPTPPPTPAISQKQFIDMIIKWGIIGLVAFVVIVSAGSKWFGLQEESRQAIVAAQQQAQQDAVNAIVEADRQTHVCGINGEKACKCQGPDKVMRYLQPGHFAKFRPVGAFNFTPPPSPNTFRICDRVGGTCVNERGKNIQLWLVGFVENTSNQVQTLSCEDETSSPN